jgi:ribosomal protein S27AE
MSNGLRLQRHLGEPATMDAGQWCAATRQAMGPVTEVHIGCPDCGRQRVLDAHVIDRQGRVTPAWACGECAYLGWIVLEAWNE